MTFACNKKEASRSPLFRKPGLKFVGSVNEPMINEKSRYDNLLNKLVIWKYLLTCLPITQPKVFFN